MAATASRYCSRNKESPSASLNERPPRLASYHKGRGYDPVIAVASFMSRVVVSIAFDPYMRRMKQSRYARRLPSSINSDAKPSPTEDARRAIKKAQKIVARYVPGNRDLVAELIEERREEAPRE
jgi:hypothetical protein